MRICFIAGEIDETPKKECIKFEIEKQIINFIEDGVKFFICDFEYGSGIEFAEVLVNLKKLFQILIWEIVLYLLILYQLHLV